MSQEERLRKELDRLISNCQVKRTTMLEISAKNATEKRRLIFIAGSLSIFSAILLSAVVADLVPEKITQFLSVICAAAGGIAAIFSSFQHSDDEVSNIFTGSSKFLGVREKASYIAMHEYLDSDEAMKNYNELVYEYTSLSEVYDKYMPAGASLKQSELRRVSAPISSAPYSDA